MEVIGRPARHLLAIALPLLAAGPAGAELAAEQPRGFTVTHQASVAAAPDEVWRALEALPRWWTDQHTGSGKAANLSLDLRAGGCWCERWGDGRSVMHGQVLWVQPGRVWRAQAALGPLQELAANAVFTLETTTQDGKTVVRLTYRFDGTPQATVEKIAPAVDRVLGDQFRRLLNFIATGEAE